VGGLERLGLSAIVLALVTIIPALVRLDLNVHAYGGLSALVAVGAVMGSPAQTRKDAFAGGLIAGVAGVWFGFLVFAPLAFMLQGGADLVELGVSILVGFGLGVVFGRAAGPVCGLGAMLGFAVSRARVPGSSA
jgi:hypothetical protein